MGCINFNPNGNQELIQSTKDGNGGCKEKENKEKNQGEGDTSGHLLLGGDTK